MPERNKSLRDCPTAYECRDQLRDLASWMSDDALKQIPIWKGARLERGKEYFDLDNPERGAFVATGDEGRPAAFTYACRSQLPETVWAQLITWRRLLSENEAEAIEGTIEALGVGRERSAAGPARPMPPR